MSSVSHSTQRLIALEQAVRRIRSAASTEAVLAAAAEALRRLTGAHAGYATIFDSGTVALSRSDAPEAERASFTALPAGGREDGERRIAGPLLDRARRPLGLIAAAEPDEGDFTEADRALLGQLAETCAMAIEILGDRTERERLEQGRDGTDAAFRSILDSASDAFFSLDPQWRVTHANPAAGRLLRRHVPELLNRSLWDSCPDLERTEPAKVFRRVMKSGAREELVWFFKPFGAWFEIRVHAHAGGLAVYFREVSERIAHEEELAERQEQLEAVVSANNRILESSLDVICIIDAQGCFVQVGPNCRQIWGYTPEELKGRSYLDLVHPDDRGITRAEAARIVTGGRPNQTFENRYLRKNGGVAHMLWSSVWSTEDQLFFVFARDITERVKLEDQLRQAHRLETIGQLAGGLAHDFNNLLTVIIGNLEIVAEGPGASHDLIAECATASLAAAERAATLTQRMLAFARRQPLSPACHHMPAIMESLREMLSRVLPATIKVSFECDAHLWPLYIDRPQLETALLNLAINARDAMPDGGELTVRARNTGSHEHGSDGQDFVAVSVADNGCGMSAEVTARAFEPFFTTKAVGKGSGLGLSMVHGFATQSGGRVALWSKPGQGALITLFLPRYVGEEAALSAVEAEVAHMGGRERVLVVEDDDAVREYVVGSLRRLGYRPVAAADGEQALLRLEAGEPFDILFTDVVMPGSVNGAELAARAQRLQPGIRVLVTTGYPNDPTILRQAAALGVGILGKPYRSGKLAIALREVLAAEPPDPVGQPA